jgi:hypothetical protein
MRAKPVSTSAVFAVVDSQCFLYVLRGLPNQRCIWFPNNGRGDQVQYTLQQSVNVPRVTLTFQSSWASTARIFDFRESNPMERVVTE